jgi:putative ubiquitin-RnfH superfamily antitoxin RatB of RatAB toxin-antitoxin module
MGRRIAVKRVRVLCDAPQGFIDCTLELPDLATIGEAIGAAHALLGRPELAEASAPMGIHGQVRPRSFVPADGDRIEIYRPLLADPRAQRRARARAVRGTPGGGTAGR